MQCVMQKRESSYAKDVSILDHGLPHLEILEIQGKIVDIGVCDSLCAVLIEQQ